MKTSQPCRKCKCEETVIQKCTNGPHQAKKLCKQCNAFISWAKLPTNNILIDPVPTSKSLF